MLFRFLSLLFGATFVASAAYACPACSGAGGPSFTIVEQLVAADAVVLASPSGEVGRYTATGVVKGTVAVGTPIAVLSAPYAAVAGDGSTLLVRQGFTRMWSVVGAVDAHRLEWLRTLAGMKRTPQMSRADWDDRVRYFFDDLQSSENFVAATAYGEIARAPYASMTVMREKLSATKLVEWVEHRDNVARRPLYILLLALAGGSDAAPVIAARLHDERFRRQSEASVALLTATIELHGQAGIARIEREWLLDKTASEEMSIAAILSLKIHAEADPSKYLEPVVASYLRLTNERSNLAGYVAVQLEALQQWKPAPAFAKMLTEGISDPASEFVILSYLRANPLRVAKEAVVRYEQRVTRQLGHVVSRQ